VAALRRAARERGGGQSQPGQVGKRPGDRKGTKIADVRLLTWRQVTPNEADEQMSVAETFTGQPSSMARAVVQSLRVMRAVTGVLRIRSGSTQLGGLLATTRPPRLTTRGLNAHRSEFEGMPVWTLVPASPSGKYVVALHGGAYVVEPTIIHWFDYASMARDTGATVVVPLYPLAPNGTASNVVPKIADHISAVIADADHDPEAVGVYGDSAGGGLALIATQELVRRGSPTPARMVLISPWVDVTMSNPVMHDIDDPLLNAADSRQKGKLWAGSLDTTDPLVSPLYGSLSGLPATAVYAGSLELLAADMLVLCDKALATPGAEFTFILRKGEMHTWALPVLPEARGVRPQIYEQLLRTDPP
jgi:triacylglycerol lipase